MGAATLLIIIQLVFLEGVLSLDNAAVLGAMVTPLPHDQPIPWPRALRRIGHRLDRLLGPQRDAALRVGLLGAYCGQAMMLALATYVVQNPWLRLVGGLYLLYLALKYLGELGREALDDDNTASQPARRSFWSVVLAVELADLAFSLDNVVAAVSLSDRFWVVYLGVAIGILIMRFAASIFSRLIEWEPNLQTAASLLILAIAVELILDDMFGIHFVELHVGGLGISGEVQQFGITLLILSLTILLSRVPALRPVNIVWRPFLWLAAMLLVPLSLVTWPLRAGLRLVAATSVE
jgi:tellurite resistance protein TerC